MVESYKFRRVKQLCLLFCVVVMAVSCSEESQDDAGKGLLNSSNFSCDIGKDGGTATVYYYEYVPFVLATEQVDKVLSGSPYSFTDGDVLKIGTYLYLPENWEYSETDLVNLIPGYKTQQGGFAECSEAMQAADVTVTTDADYVDYDWVKASITRDRIDIAVLPNDTGQERSVALIFYLTLFDYCNAIVITQPAD